MRVDDDHGIGAVFFWSAALMFSLLIGAAIFQSALETQPEVRQIDSGSGY